ncbi:MAG: tryptophan synthase subunit alpha [Candidatus Firestonebacteria bacterium]
MLGDYCRKSGKKVFIVYITCGYPDLKTTENLILEFSKIGVDVIELGIPFSDPIADGPTIQKAGNIALSNNVNLYKVFKMVKRIRSRVKSGLAIMSYYNIIYQYGLKRFVIDCKKYGVDGIIVPDLIPEEGKYLIKLSKEYNVNLVFLLAPTSSLNRIKLVSKHSSGFIYCVSLTGVTGERSRIPDIKDYINKIKRYTHKPIAVGFGISKSSQIREILKSADGVIIGSAIIKKMSENIKSKNLVKNVVKFVNKLKKESVKCQVLTPKVKN